MNETREIDLATFDMRKLKFRPGWPERIGEPMKQTTIALGERFGFSIFIGPKLLENFDKWVNEAGYSTRSEAIRFLMQLAAMGFISPKTKEEQDGKAKIRPDE